MLPATPRLAVRKLALPGACVALAAFALALPASTVVARTYTIQEGDTLSAIAARHGRSVEELAGLNGLEDPDHIFAGQVLALDGDDGGPAVASPSSRIHRVAAGETLSLIASSYGVDFGQLLEVNGIEDADYVQAGQELSLPVSQFMPAPLSRLETEAILRAAAAEFGVDPALVLGLAWLESGWNQNMTSQAGAVGVMQLLPATAEWGLEYLAPDAGEWETSTRDNARLGTAVFAHMWRQAGRDLELALAFYYQGWASIERYGVFEETERYVANVLALAEEFR